MRNAKQAMIVLSSSSTILTAYASSHFAPVLGVHEISSFANRQFFACKAFWGYCTSKEAFASILTGSAPCSSMFLNGE
jgi:hypothetical protein